MSPDGVPEYVIYAFNSAMSQAVTLPTYDGGVKLVPRAPRAPIARIDRNLRTAVPHLVDIEVEVRQRSGARVWFVGVRYVCGESCRTPRFMERATREDGLLCRRCVQAAVPGTCVYRIYGRRGRLLYVGCTDNLTARLKQHAVTASWWSDAVEVQHDRHDTRKDALAAELAAIRNLRPLYNVQGAAA